MANRRLMFGLYATSSRSEMILDASELVLECVAKTGEHGFATLSFTLRLSLERAFYLYERASLPHAAIYDGAELVWEGRVEDMAIVPEGLQCTAFGYWRAYSDLPYNVVWSYAGTDRWETYSNYLHYLSDRFEINKNNQNLNISPRKGMFFLGSNTIGAQYLRLPSGSERVIAQFSAAYTIKNAGFGAAGWRFDIAAYPNDPYDGGVVVWGGTTLASGTYSGSMNFDLPLGYKFIAMRVYASSDYFTTEDESGSIYFQLTNPRVKTYTPSLTADVIVRDIASKVYVTNAAHGSDQAAYIQSPAVELYNEVYEDADMIEVLRRLASYGDSSGTTRWEVGVYDHRALYFRPRGSNGRRWYVDIAELTALERTADSLVNSTYATFETWDGKETRSATFTDDASVNRWRVTRQRAVEANTVDATQAEKTRAAVHADGVEPRPRAQFVVRQVFTATGTPVPPWLVRAGDTVTIRNLSPTLSSSIDRVRTFIVAETEMDMLTGKLSITPESPLPQLDYIVSQRQTARFTY